MLKFFYKNKYLFYLFVVLAEFIISFFLKTILPETRNISSAILLIITGSFVTGIFLFLTILMTSDDILAKNFLKFPIIVAFVFNTVFILAWLFKNLLFAFLIIPMEIFSIVITFAIIFSIFPYAFLKLEGGNKKLKLEATT